MDQEKIDYRPYSIAFEYLSDGTTAIVAPTAESAGEAAKVLLARNGLKGVNIVSVSEIDDTPPDC